MAAALKIKLVIAGISIFILVLILLVENKFFAPVTIKRWGQLTWNDFQGIPPPFSVWGAAISSTVYMEYDSALKRYVAYAGQNDIQSWAKRSEEEQSYGLKHEQYHFNITELQARKLNQYILENPDLTLHDYLLRLISVKSDLRVMQWRYDRETRHSLNYDKQARWEYQIDSQMTQARGLFTDYLSGAQVFFPHRPDSVKVVEPEGAGYRCYYVNEYEMQFAVNSYHLVGLVVSTLPGTVKSREQNSGRKVVSMTVDTTEQVFKLFAVSEDTVNQTYHKAWIYDRPYLYHIYARYPNNKGDTTGYARNAQSFLNSFRIIDTDDYWISRSRAADSTVNFVKVSKYDGKKESDTEYCAVYKHAGRLGLYRGPFHREDGAVILAYDYLLHPDSVRFEDVVVVNDEWSTHAPDPQNHFFFLPADKVPKTRTGIAFGYLLLKDTAEYCYQFYHEGIYVTPLVRETAEGDN